MRHHSNKRKFSLQPNTGATMMTFLMLEIIEHGKITTTVARAKEVRPMIERMVTKAKMDTLANRRYVQSRLFNNEASVVKMFSDIAPAMKERPGGYTRVVRLGARKSDAAPLAIIEFVK